VSSYENSFENPFCKRPFFLNQDNEKSKQSKIAQYLSKFIVFIGQARDKALCQSILVNSVDISRQVWVEQSAQPSSDICL
jgi:hypothetical protein